MPQLSHFPFSIPSPLVASAHIFITLGLNLMKVTIMAASSNFPNLIFIVLHFFFMLVQLLLNLSYPVISGNVSLSYYNIPLHRVLLKQSQLSHSHLLLLIHRSASKKLHRILLTVSYRIWLTENWKLHLLKFSCYTHVFSLIKHSIFLSKLKPSILRCLKMGNASDICFVSSQNCYPIPSFQKSHLGILLRININIKRKPGEVKW